MIICHSDTDLRLGQTISIAGKKWAFIRGDAGHSRKGALFKPDRGKLPCTPTSLRELKTQRHIWEVCLEQLFDAHDAVWRIPDFATSSPEQLAKSFATIHDAQKKAAALRPHLQTIWRDYGDLEQLYRLRVEFCLKHLREMDRDAWDFQHNELGVPCPVAVRSIAEGLL